MNCNNCGSELMQNDEKCNNCGIEITNENRVYCEAEYKNKKAVWSPNAIKYITIFCSLIPGAILFSMNYARLEHPQKINRILKVIVISVLFFFLAFVSPSNTLINYLFLGINIGLAIYFSNDQKNLFENHIKNGGKKASIVIPLILSIALIVLFLVLLIISLIMFSEDTMMGTV